MKKYFFFLNFVDLWSSLEREQEFPKIVKVILYSFLYGDIVPLRGLDKVEQNLMKAQKGRLFLCFSIPSLLTTTLQTELKHSMHVSIHQTNLILEQYEPVPFDDQNEKHLILSNWYFLCRVLQKGEGPHEVAAHVGVTVPEED